MKELLDFLVKSVVSSPDRVEISELSGERAVVFEIRVAEEDMARIIGRHGRVINAIRAIVNAAGKRVDKKASIELIE